VPIKPPKTCAQGGCWNATTEKYCKEHAKQNDATERDRLRKQDEVAKWYVTARWRRFRAALRLQGNILCQAVHDGVRCSTLAVEYHHIVSPRERPELFLVASNVVGLCRACHDKKAGTPHWLVGIDYIATIWRTPHVGGPLPASVAPAVEPQPVEQTAPAKPSLWVTSSLPPQPTDPDAAAKTASLLDRVKNKYSIA
jgi:5-methylcytosine-specific restriction protein A